MMTAEATRSTEEGMALLRRHRAELIAAGQQIARFLAEINGTVHSRAVRDEMERRGLLNGDGSECWLGAVFNGKNSGLEWTGHWYRYTVKNNNRNIHEKHIKIWRLKGENRDGQ